MKRNKTCVIMALALALLVSGCKKKAEEQEVRKVKVECLEMAPSQVTGGRNYVGTVEEKDGAVVSFNVLGTVTRIYADEGQMVKKGQPLAQVDGHNVRQSYEMAASTLRQAEDAHKRLSELYKRGTLPEIKMVEMETELSKARAAEQISRKSLNDIVLKAPFSGYIAKRMVNEGAAATPGFGAFKLVKIDQVKVKLSVPENEIGQIRVGQQIAFTVPALNNRQYLGRVSTKGVEASFMSHSYDVKLLVSNARHELLPGMVCSAVLQTSSNLGSD
ncbi:MAG: efflux RND transporter periplasmic adaptor subunit, partial [Prevotella sp.]|nr:efflux RND transporter periplasmic adaptor subunit [Prevotella sp.]